MTSLHRVYNVALLHRFQDATSF